VGTRVLYVTAHPDDEHNGVLAALTRGRGVKTGLFTLTRGEGGQNAIGPELFDALGVLRTEELLAAHRYDGAVQLFGRAFEFGYSFSVEESLARWGHDEALGDVVRAFRVFRPDVVLTLPLEGQGGGQHHQAVARLAQEAFTAAADPQRFPEQVTRGLRPWQARKLYQGATGGGPTQIPGIPVLVATGRYDPLLGMTWQELGAIASSFHRCQGVPQVRVAPGPAEARYGLVEARPPVLGTEEDILDGIDPSLRGWGRLAEGPRAPSQRLTADLEALDAALRAPGTAFAIGDTLRVEVALNAALTRVREVMDRLVTTVPEADAQQELRERLDEKRLEIEKAQNLAFGIRLDVRSDSATVVPGQTLGVTARIFNPGPGVLALRRLAISAPTGSRVEATGPAPKTVAPGAAVDLVFRVTVAEDARPSQPWWRRHPGSDRHDVLVPADEGRPFSPPAITATLHYQVGGAESTLEAPALWRYAGPLVGGEKQHLVLVVPALGVHLEPDVTVLPLVRQGPPREIRVWVRSYLKGRAVASVRLEAPAGFTVSPASAPVGFSGEGEEILSRFQLTPPADLAPGQALVRAVARQGEREYSEDVRVVAYDHIQKRHLLEPAEGRLLALDVKVAAGVKVGYVAGSGDSGIAALQQLGLSVVSLSAADLAEGNLARFTTIVTGIRAYEVRPDLLAHHGRLLEYVKGGGHLVVQYNRAPFNGLPALADSPFAPYPASVTAERVTDEEAPVRLLLPGHPLLTTPNPIGAGDFAGWVQERGIQLLSARDDRYADLLSSSDPFANNPGEKKGLLVEAQVGKGTWTYLGLALFRQWPAGVPGAYRLLANLVSRPPGR
jgi:LmbE family N-acetylglucosaminyl deacetylase